MISVLGCGVVGLCAATALAEAGHEVEVIAPDDAPAPASHLAGGMLAPFCEGESAPDLVVTRGQAAVDWWVGHVAGVERRGTLVLAPPRDAVELDRFARATRGHRWIVPETLEPELSGRFARGLFFAGEAHLDPRAALDDLRQRLLSRGVPFGAGAPRGRIVDCRGIAAADRLPDLRAVRGEMVEVMAPEVALTRTVRLIHPRFPCYIVPRGAGRFMIGATMVESARSGPVTARAVMELLSAAWTVHPAFAEAELIATGAGLRPAFPDNLPAIRRAGDRIHVNGMYRHGFLMAPVLATDLAAIMTEEMTHAH
ncbi:FAD-dependent oxidoreductase [Celeribacter indicus]|uniref:D-amino-acid oxidase n=1 Tax=Celeribacter indicus TaxID=1208324 RepID=A0A0B5DYY0_9RHOB|nr:FAD-dependent oxidoreductase [Celeribacter indicus]AJE45437.1 thiamine biosynthesis oxidoreductase ThiO [Celeribacter indicus]SDX01960.1 glycine oxidase [Celeribacter indicus]